MAWRPQLSSSLRCADAIAHPALANLAHVPPAVQLLRQPYKDVLEELADQFSEPEALVDMLAAAVRAAAKAARGVPGATAPENTGAAGVGRRKGKEEQGDG